MNAHISQRQTPWSEGRIVIIPFLHGKLNFDGTVTEPDIDTILEKWLARHPEHREKKFHVIRSQSYSVGEIDTQLVRVTADFSPDLEDYDPTEDADLYEEFLAEKQDSPPPLFRKIWIEQCEAAEGIEADYGTEKALGYLIGEKLLNFLEVAERKPEWRAEVPLFIAKIKDIFEPWQIAKFLETRNTTKDPAVHVLHLKQPIHGLNGAQIIDRQRQVADEKGN